MNKTDYKRIDHLLRKWHSKQISESRGLDAKLELNDYPECWISQVIQSRYLPKGDIMNHFEPLFVPLRGNYARMKHICVLYSHCKLYGAMPESRYSAVSKDW